MRIAPRLPYAIVPCDATTGVRMTKTNDANRDGDFPDREVLGRTITPTKTPPGGTAFTGSNGTLGFGAMALALLLFGSGLMWAGYRRRRQYDT